MIERLGCGAVCSCGVFERRGQVRGRVDTCLPVHNTNKTFSLDSLRREHNDSIFDNDNIWDIGSVLLYLAYVKCKLWFWIRSILEEFILVHRTYTAVAYSNTGLIGVLYAVSLVNSGATLSFLLIKWSVRKADEHMLVSEHTSAKTRCERYTQVLYVVDSGNWRSIKSIVIN